MGEFHTEKQVDFCGDSFHSQEMLTEHESKKHREEALGPKQPKLFVNNFFASFVKKFLKSTANL